MERNRDGDEGWRVREWRALTLLVECKVLALTLKPQPEDADGELDQFAPRRCFNLSSGTSTLPGQSDEGSLAMGSSSDGATSVRRGAIPTAKRRRLSGPRSRCVHVQLVWW